jgi:hypothetical protein
MATVRAPDIVHRYARASCVLLPANTDGFNDRCYLLNIESTPLLVGSS